MKPELYTEFRAALISYENKNPDELGFYLEDFALMTIDYPNDNGEEETFRVVGTGILPIMKTYPEIPDSRISEEIFVLLHNDDTDEYKEIELADMSDEDITELLRIIKSAE